MPEITLELAENFSLEEVRNHLVDYTVWMHKVIIRNIQTKDLMQILYYREGSFFACPTLQILV